VSLAPQGDEHRLREACFGGEVAISLSGPRAPERGAEAINQLHEIDRRLSRFRTDSELSLLNSNPREVVPASPLLLDLVEAIMAAGVRTGGLVDGTLLDELERAGYVNSMSAGASPLPRESQPAPEARTVGRERTADWSDLAVHRTEGEVRRPPGLRIDSGGLGKGLAADRVAAGLSECPTFCVDCSGDMLIGGTSGQPRIVRVKHPFTAEIVCEFELAEGGVATSGITRRAWFGEDGRPRHHLIDPRTGEPARTGVIQATALAPTATEAEVLAKAALLAGPAHGQDWLPHGGVLVLKDGSTRREHPARKPARVA
jgi:FAD:protein FMN transferase